MNKHLGTSPSPPPTKPSGGTGVILGALGLLAAIGGVALAGKKTGTKTKSAPLKGCGCGR